VFTGVSDLHPGLTYAGKVGSPKVEFSHVSFGFDRQYYTRVDVTELTNTSLLPYRIYCDPERFWYRPRLQSHFSDGKSP